ncbi:hypothetical protein ROHU_024597 [Labeo rohita]|uniref:Uncharacterized protein n=1 Tax=Labeo rohita TaxID=84645 RepID=A0A498MI24_LABRO|nr:hypothetical protein ROHU_024597 [Labeo rohita]
MPVGDAMKATNHGSHSPPFPFPVCLSPQFLSRSSRRRQAMRSRTMRADRAHLLPAPDGLRGSDRPFTEASPPRHFHLTCTNSFLFTLGMSNSHSSLRLTHLHAHQLLYRYKTSFLSESRKHPPVTPADSSFKL